MSFLDIKDPTKRMTLIDEHVRAMKTVRRRNMVNREAKLVIGEELQTLFHPIVSATKQAGEQTVKGVTAVKEALADIDDAFTAQQVMRPLPIPLPPQKDLTFCVFQRADGRLGMGNKVVHIEDNRLKVDDKEYKLKPCLRVLILHKKPRPQHYSSDDYSKYKALVGLTWVRTFPNTTTGSTRPNYKWKRKHMLKNMVIHGDRADEESEDSDTGIG